MVNSKKGKRMDSDESDEDYGENDAFVSADRVLPIILNLFL